LVETRVAFGEQGDADAGGDQLEDLVCGGGLGRHDRWTGTGVDSEPEVAEWTGRRRKSYEGLVQEQLERDRWAVRQGMLGG
jgi:hypothetical protein